MRPFQSPFNVNLAADPLLDAWRGARDFGKAAPSSAFFDRAQYEVLVTSEVFEYYSDSHIWSFILGVRIGLLRRTLRI